MRKHFLIDWFDYHFITILLHFLFFLQSFDSDEQYFCIFCLSIFSDRTQTRRHYQEHVDYYPIVCNHCGISCTDLGAFERHLLKRHPQRPLNRAYAKRFEPDIENWLDNFLFSQLQLIKSIPHRPPCPVCNRLRPNQPKQDEPIGSNSFAQAVDHVHQHLCYFPFECLKCKSQGNEYFIALNLSKAKLHIDSKHPELDQTKGDCLNVFRKTVEIPKVDELIRKCFLDDGIKFPSYLNESKGRIFDDGDGKNEEEKDIHSLSTNSNHSHFSLLNTSLNLNPNCLNLCNEPLNSNQGLFEQLLCCNETMPELSDAPLSKISQVADTMNQSLFTLTPNNMSTLHQTLNQTESNAHLKPETDQSKSKLTHFSNLDSDQIDFSNTTNLTISKKNADQIEPNSSVTKPFICIFCNQRFASQTLCYDHYCLHLSYHPFRCRLCSQSFTSIERFRVHHQSEHSSHRSAQYELQENSSISIWLNQFFSLQQPNDIVKLDCHCSNYCPLCVKAGTCCTFKQCNFINHSSEFIREHIFRHLSYPIFECLTCQGTTQPFRLNRLQEQAYHHLKKHHRVQASSISTDLLRYYRKCVHIPLVERIVEDCIRKYKNYVDSHKHVIRNPTIKPLPIKSNDDLPALNTLQPLNPNLLQSEALAIKNPSKTVRLK